MQNNHSSFALHDNYLDKAIWWIFPAQSRTILFSDRYRFILDCWDGLVQTNMDIDRWRLKQGWTTIQSRDFTWCFEVLVLHPSQHTSTIFYESPDCQFTHKSLFLMSNSIHWPYEEKRTSFNSYRGNRAYRPKAKSDSQHHEKMCLLQRTIWSPFLLYTFLLQNVLQSGLL